MSRFGTTLTFTYYPLDGDGIATTLTLLPDQMPQYPFETTVVTDEVSYRTKNGKKYSFENYNLSSYSFSWNLVDIDTRNQLKNMYDANPVINLQTNGSSWGNFRRGDASWKDSESAFNLFDLGFVLEEDVVTF